MPLPLYSTAPYDAWAALARIRGDLDECTRRVETLAQDFDLSIRRITNMQGEIERLRELLKSR